MFQLQTVRDTLTRIESYGLWTVLIEMSLIALVVWLAMRFLRGTRGARLVKGAALLLAVVYVVIQLLPKAERWDRLQFLYTRFLIFAVLAAVVIFQPELRRALMQLGQARLFRVQASRAEAVIAQLCQSAAYLSRNKIGALVAIERSVGLGGLIENGTPVDSELTADLLNTIFYPGSALHDMGVVVQNGRVAAAGVQFPLAESGSLDRSLGSRHRAALGLSEESDAVIIVVSEETGRVSLAYDGQLSVGVDPDRLRDMLSSLISPAGPLWPRKKGGKDSAPFWRPRLPEPRKLAASLRTFLWVALVTVLVWVWADLERTDEATGQRVSLRVTAPRDTDLLIERPDPETGVEIAFNCAGPQAGLSELLRVLGEGRQRLTVSAKRDWAAGPHTIDTLEALNDWPLLKRYGVTAHSAEPAEINVQVDRWAPRTAKVKFEYSGALLESEPSIQPQTVDVHVPESKLGDVEELTISTVSVDLTTLAAGQETVRQVDLAPRVNGTPVRLATQPTRVQVTFRKQANFKTLQVPVQIRLSVPPVVAEQIAREGYVLERRDESEWRRELIIQGASVEIDRLKGMAVSAIVEIVPEDLSPVSNLERDVTVVLPPELPSLQLIEPASLKVNFRFVRQPVAVP